MILKRLSSHCSNHSYARAKSSETPYTVRARSCTSRMYGNSDQVTFARRLVSLGERHSREEKLCHQLGSRRFFRLS